MKIGIDLRPLQTGHKYRGIGEVTKQTTNRILRLAKDDPKHPVSFVFYEYDDKEEDPKDLLTIPKGLEYEVVKLGIMPKKGTIQQKLARQVKDLFGNPVAAEKSDVFLQFDFAMGVPKNTKTALVKHDIIPYIFWDQYFTSPMVHVKNKALRTTLRTMLHNFRAMRLLRRSLSDAKIILTVSENTRKDLHEHFGVPEAKMKVAFLGVSVEPAKTTSKQKVQMPTKPYLLFLGGIDAKRRAVDDIVHAYNNLKAAGHDIQVVLAGENFASIEAIPHEGIRNAIKQSSYNDDILLLGYIDDATKQALYKNALAFVYPTSYEGFGIPVLESMLLGCPIITYKNSSIPEVGGSHAFYAHDWMGIKKQAEKLLAMSPQEREKAVAAAKQHAEQFTWDKTAQVIYDELIEQVG